MKGLWEIGANGLTLSPCSGGVAKQKKPKITNLYFVIRKCKVNHLEPFVNDRLFCAVPKKGLAVQSGKIAAAQWQSPAIKRSNFNDRKRSPRHTRRCLTLPHHLKGLRLTPTQRAGMCRLLLFLCHLFCVRIAPVLFGHRGTRITLQGRIKILTRQDPPGRVVFTEVG